jgi:hypothetical protein
MPEKKGMRIKEWGGASRMRLDSTVRPLVQFMGKQNGSKVYGRILGPWIGCDPGESIPTDVHQ